MLDITTPKAANLAVKIKRHARVLMPLRAEFTAIYSELMHEYTDISRQIVLHRVRKHYCEPEKACYGREPNKPRAPIDMHKEKHHARHLCESDQKGDKRVRTRKYEVKIHGRSVVCKDRADDKHRKNPEVLRNGHVVMF
jgi:hypothetical protein